MELCLALPQEQCLFRRLAVFAGSWSLEAVEAVCSDETLPGSQLLDLLMQLVDHSLVAVQGSEGIPRYAMLETIREYGWEQSQVAEKVAKLQERHYAYFLSLAEQAAPDLLGSRADWWIQRLEQDHDNLRAALEWALERGDGERAGSLASALRRFWQFLGYTTEGRRWLEAALAYSNSVPEAVRARMLHAVGALAWRQGDRASAERAFTQSLALWDVLEDQQGRAHALMGLGLVQMH